LEKEKVEMSADRKERESGQVLVIFVFALVVLLGFTALAIDSGLYYSDRRYDQNAADASALAGGGAAAESIQDSGLDNSFSCADVDGDGNVDDANVQAAIDAAVAAAVQRAAGNNFAIDDHLFNKHGVVAECGSDEAGGYIDVYVMITSDVQTSFAHMFFAGRFRNTVEAVSRSRAGGMFALGNTIFAMDDDCHGNDGGVTFDGDADVEIDVGGVVSNACMVVNGGVDVTVETGSITYVTEYDDHGASGVIDPTPVQDGPLAKLSIPAPDCDSLTDYARVQNGGNISSGHYPSIRVTSGDLVMEPGLYCVDGSFTANGGTISVSGDDMDGVTIYIINGDFDTTGNVTVNLRASMPDAHPPTVPAPNGSIYGLLIYLAAGNTGEASLLGDSTSTYRGTVFAPDGTIKVGGGSSTMSNYFSQFIANTVKIHGTSDMEITFDEDMIFQGAPSLSLYK
jgi:hypothetical protein